ncbi:MAG: 50S ribosomal protein L4, partial [Candidatus Dormibacteraeota bacterium]|nr:50S ribosomal protein L4 [Candidatus Dormibacteraeota bacterium]
PEVSAEIPMMADALAPEGEVEKPAATKKAAKKPVATKPPAKAVDKTTAKSIVAGKAGRVEAEPRAKAGKPARKAVAKKGESPLDVVVFDGAGEQSGELRLPEAIFGQAPNMGVMHQALQRQLNNARQGTSSTKTRAQVRGGGRKPFRQKGLGRSRHGSEREPSMVGGGIAFGPHPRSYRQEMPRKMRRLALRSALAVKASEGKVSVIEGFADMAVPRTRTIVDLLDALGVEGTALVVLAASNDMVARSAANLTWAKTILAHNLNLYDIFTHDHVVIARDALELIEETFQA